MRGSTVYRSQEGNSMIWCVLLGCEYEVKRNCEVKEFKQLIRMLGMSTRERPDVGLYFFEKSGGLFIIGIEVHSSPFEHTIKKCIVGVTDALRLIRANNSDISECVGFVFPKDGN